MLIPYSTDAPIYYYPITTVSLIVINVLCFFAFCLGPVEDVAFTLVDPSGQVFERAEAERKARELVLEGKDPEVFLESLEIVLAESQDWREQLILQFGQGYRPWQWITNMFMHAGIMHLVGNMIFLWSFGLVVEGKVGNAAFAGLYLGMGIVQSIIVQTLMWFSVGGALGASGAIFAVLALVVILAPVNCFDVMLWIMLRPFTFEMPHIVFGGIYLALNVVFFAIGGATMGSEALHLIGFFVGLPVGLFLLTQGWVDCEGYDIISHWQGNKGKKSKVGKRKRKARETALAAKSQAGIPLVTPQQTEDLIRGQMNLAISQRSFPVAVALQQKLDKEVPGSGWHQSQLAAVIKGYLQDKNYVAAEPLMHTHIESFEQSRFSMQAYLVKLWLQAHRPRHVLRYLKAIDPALLNAEQILELRKLAKHAKQQIDDGVLEVE